MVAALFIFAAMFIVIAIVAAVYDANGYVIVAPLVFGFALLGLAIFKAMRHEEEACHNKGGAIQETGVVYPITTYIQSGKVMIPITTYVHETECVIP